MNPMWFLRAAVLCLLASLASLVGLPAARSAAPSLVPVPVHWLCGSTADIRAAIPPDSKAIGGGKIDQEGAALYVAPDGEWFLLIVPAVDTACLAAVGDQWHPAGGGTAGGAVGPSRLKPDGFSVPWHLAVRGEYVRGPY